MNKFQYSPPKNAPVTSEDLLKDLQSVAGKLNTKKISQSLYLKNGKYGSTTIKRRFGTWNKALFKANLKLAKINYHSNKKLFENLLNVWQRKGAQPRQSDIDSSMSEIKSGVYKKRFGNWTTAVKKFIEYANEKDISATEKHDTKISKKKTSRNPSLRLRFNVLKRDNFSCVKCGASPAKNPSVVLEIDHIIPWSKDGETEISNLQTLCQNCNLGKSNLD
ncbi:MAG: HNH endonuclease [Bacteroidetes bacterium]|nr:HNH endonuclease [Bacteroidota bacterium]